MKRNLIFTLVLTISISLSVMFIPCQSEARDVTRVSVDSAGGEADDRSRYSSISSDGRWVTFSSEATNLTAITITTTNVYNVYIKDTQTGEIVLASKDIGGAEGGDDESENPKISTDGLYVVFQSSATNLVAGDTNGKTDIFLYDRIADTLERISLTTGLVQTTTGSSYDPAITPDGGYVVFESNATDLVAGDGNGCKDVFLYDSGAAGNGITRVSMDGSVVPVEGNAISCDPDISDDGLFVAFASLSTNLVTPVTTLVGYHVYLKDITSGAVTLLSQNGGLEGNGDSEYPSISADGSAVAFESDATNLIADDLNTDTDVFVWSTGGVALVSEDSAGENGDRYSRDASISADGSYVAFESNSYKLVTPNTTYNRYNVYIKNISTGAIEIVSVDNSGVEGDEDSYDASLSHDGSYVAFDSEVALVAGDGNGQRDVFVSTPSSSSTPPAGGGGGGGGCFINTCSIFK